MCKFKPVTNVGGTSIRLPVHPRPEQGDHWKVKMRSYGLVLTSESFNLCPLVLVLCGIYAKSSDASSSRMTGPLYIFLYLEENSMASSLANIAVSLVYLMHKPVIFPNQILETRRNPFRRCLVHKCAYADLEVFAGNQPVHIFLSSSRGCVFHTRIIPRFS